jgi:hypothetical protein
MNVKAILIAVSIFSLNLFAAEIQPVTQKTRAAELADTAANIFWVKNVNIGKYAYKVVSMDSALNGDLTSTIFVIIGEGAVGGGAGYEQAFQIAPTEEIAYVRKVSVDKGTLQLDYVRPDGTKSKTSYVYDATKRVLVQK